MKLGVEGIHLFLLIFIENVRIDAHCHPFDVPLPHMVLLIVDHAFDSFQLEIDIY